MTVNINLKDLKNPPAVGDLVDIEDEGVFGGAPCEGEVVYSDGKWITLMRGDTDECKTFGYYALKATKRFKRNKVKCWQLVRTGMGDI